MSRWLTGASQMLEKAALPALCSHPALQLLWEEIKRFSRVACTEMDPREMLLLGNSPCTQNFKTRQMK